MRPTVRRAMRSAISSLPVPDSPWINTVVSGASATLSTMSITFFIAADEPTTRSPIAACARPVSWRTCARSRWASIALRTVTRNSGSWSGFDR